MNKRILIIMLVGMALGVIFYLLTPNQSSAELSMGIKSEKVVEIVNTGDLPIKEYAEYHIDSYFGEGQFYYFDKIIMKESSWRVNKEHYKDSKVRIKSPNSVDLPDSWIHHDEYGYYYISSAYGLAGFLNATWGEVGCTKTEDMYIQVDCAMKYIEKRYDTPQEAYRIHQIKNSY